jgi:HD-GYP domain-containing protein (c-di-GMP phosphodiesterase class II)
MWMTTMALATAAGVLPTALWGREWTMRRRLQLEYNIRMAQSLGRAATLRDHETGAHNYRVTYLASLFGEACGLDRLVIRSLMKGAFLHDVGKIGIPDAILLKQGPLDERERAVMREHPVMGVNLLSDMPWFQDAIPVVRHHHEHFDGTGYPDGLVGEAIPFVARIFAVVDVFDALLAARPYKSAFPMQKVLSAIEEGCTRHFDTAIGEAFLRHAPDFSNQVLGRSERELKEMLELRRRRIFGV